MNKEVVVPVVSCGLGVITSVVVASVYGFVSIPGLSGSSTHPIGYVENSNQVHVHSDFIVYLNGETFDFSDERYMTSSVQELHAHVHLHDGDDKVIHRHDHGVTLDEFFDSLGFTLTDECIMADTGEQYCTNEREDLALALFVNGERVWDIDGYVNQEEDRILLYYGLLDDTETLEALKAQITDNSCYYSGTCPERGVAPPESCGLTCEL